MGLQCTGAATIALHRIEPVPRHVTTLLIDGDVKGGDDDDEQNVGVFSMDEVLSVLNGRCIVRSVGRWI